jgi:hypothetical protein
MHQSTRPACCSAAHGFILLLVIILKTVFLLCILTICCSYHLDHLLSYHPAEDADELECSKGVAPHAVLRLQKPGSTKTYFSVNQTCLLAGSFKIPSSQTP